MTNETPDPRGTPGAAGDPAASGAGDASISEMDVPAFQPASGAPRTFTQPLFSVPPARTRRRITLTSMLLAAAAVIAVAGVSFAVGRVTAPAATTPTGFGGRTFANGNGVAGGGPGAGGGGFFGGGAAGDIQLNGTVTAVNGSTITLQLSNGRTIDVQTSSSTTYHTQVAGSASDVTSGKTVTIQVQGGGGLRDLFGRGGTGNGSVTVPAADVTVTGQ